MIRFFIMGAKIWNSTPENLRNSSKSLFKEKVHTILLKIFDVQDRYADLNTIISDFKKILALTSLNCCLDFLISISLVTDHFNFILNMVLFSLQLFVINLAPSTHHLPRLALLFADCVIFVYLCMK